MPAIIAIDPLKVFVMDGFIYNRPLRCLLYDLNSNKVIQEVKKFHQTPFMYHFVENQHFIDQATGKICLLAASYHSMFYVEVQQHDLTSVNFQCIYSEYHGNCGEDINMDELFGASDSDY